MKALDKILKARSILILDHPFFGSLALRLGLVENNRLETSTVNGKEMFYNSEFIDSLSIREATGVMAHEVMHLALGHGWRMGNRERVRWNIACDYTINENLQSSFTLPKCALTDDTYNTMSAEAIYEELGQEEQKQKNKKDGQDQSEDKEQGNDGGQGDGEDESNDKDNKNDDTDNENRKDNQDKKEQSADPGGCGSIEPIKDQDEANEMKATWQAAVAQAAQMSQGELPADIQLQIDELLNPSIPWYILLRDFVEKTARNDYDWTRPSRRYPGLNVILPSLISEQLPEVVIAIDTSGSIDTESLSKFSAEASNVLGAYDTTIRVIFCDSRIHKEEVYTRADLPMKLKPIGGGGTDFRPVFDYIKKNNHTPACLIYFTDLYGSFPIQEPEYPTMWLTTTEDKEAPFGITVDFN